MLWKLWCNCLQRRERPVLDVASLDRASADPRDGDRRLALDVLFLVLDAGFDLALDRRSLEVELDLELAADVLRRRAVLELDRHERVELAALDEPRDERVAVHAGEVRRAHTLDRAELGEVRCDKLLVGDLDLDEVVDVALFELVRVQEGRACAAAAADCVALDLQRALVGDRV